MLVLTSADIQQLFSRFKSVQSAANTLPPMEKPVFDAFFIL
tara:strand:- start:361 stop:483 length:123 start_codon:yes stop_codon:yes gene_type:complete